MEEYGPDDGDDIEDQEEAEVWTEGQCDNCTGSSPAEVAAAAMTSAIIPVCACAIGQGATDGTCVCGPEDDQ